MNIFDEPVISIDRKGLHIVSSDIYEKLEKKNLSASLITGVSGCPARWLAESFVMRDLIQDEPDNAARRGVVYHLIMELFFQETPNNRTKKKLNEITNHVLTLDEFSDLAQIPDFLQWLKQSIRNYYDMGAKPELVEVAQIKNEKGELKTGLEIFVKGNIGDTKRDILGFIDRLIVDKRSKDYAVFIEDWKGLALDTPLPTLDGWTTMKDVQVNDFVLGTKGYAVKVIAKSEIHNRPCYKITFCDTSEIICDNVHLWNIQLDSNNNGSNKNITVNSDELYEYWINGSRSYIQIENPEPLIFEEKELPINPYNFGIWLGDDNSNGGITTDMNNLLYHKRIPIEFLRASYDQRLELLRGLMDIGGYWHPEKELALFYTNHKELANDFAELIVTLSLTPTINQGEKDFKQFYDVGFSPVIFNPFKLAKKADLINEYFTANLYNNHKETYRIVKNIEIINSVPTQCIKVDADNSLYLCGPLMTPTHNTGGKVKKWKHHTKGDEGLAEARQQVIYKMLLEQQDIKVTGARLIFPVAKEIVNVDVNNENFNNRVINDVKLADEKLDAMTEENTFEYVPSFLYAWCPLAKICSAATIKPYKKMQDAFKDQPSPELLTQAFEVI